MCYSSSFLSTTLHYGRNKIISRFFVIKRSVSPFPRGSPSHFHSPPHSTHTLSEPRGSWSGTVGNSNLIGEITLCELSCPTGNTSLKMCRRSAKEATWRELFSLAGHICWRDMKRDTLSRHSARPLLVKKCSQTILLKFLLRFLLRFSV